MLGAYELRHHVGNDLKEILEVGKKLPTLIENCNELGETALTEVLKEWEAIAEKASKTYDAREKRLLNKRPRMW